MSVYISSNGRSYSNSSIQIITLFILLIIGHLSDSQSQQGNENMCNLILPLEDFGVTPVIRYYYSDPDCLPFNYTGQLIVLESSFATYEECENYCINGYTDPPPDTPPPTDPPTNPPTKAPFDNPTGDICLYDYDVGDGVFIFPAKKFFFNRTILTCQWFLYRSPGGNPNRFDTEEDCMERCGDTIWPIPTNSTTSLSSSSAVVSTVLASVQILSISVTTTTTTTTATVSFSNILSTMVTQISSSTIPAMATPHHSEGSSTTPTMSMPRHSKGSSTTPTMTIPRYSEGVFVTSVKATPTESMSSQLTPTESITQSRNTLTTDVSVVLIYSLFFVCSVVILLFTVISGLVMCALFHRHRRVVSVNVHTERGDGNVSSMKHWFPSVSTTTSVTPSAPPLSVISPFPINQQPTATISAFTTTLPTNGGDNPESPSPEISHDHTSINDIPS